MSPQSESPLRHYFSAFRRRWAAGLFTAATVIALLVPVALGLPNLYRSSASLIVDQAPDPLAQRDTQMIELSGRLQTIRQEALSRQRVLALAEELDLYRPLREAGAIDGVVAMMQRDVKVEPTSASRGDGRTTTISFRISYTGGDPQQAAKVANSLARFYVERNDDMMSRVATRTAETVKGELDRMRLKLAEEERRVIQYTEQNAGTLPTQVAAMQTKVSQLTQQLQANSGEITRRMDAREGAQIQIANLSSSPTAANASDPSIRLAAAERDLADLRMRYTDADFRVRNKKNEVEGLRALVAQGKGKPEPANGESSLLVTLRRQIDEWGDRIEALQQENVAIQAELKKYETVMERAPVRNAEFERYNREAAQTRAQYDLLYLRYQNALVGERAQGRGTAEFQVLDAAVPPESPSAPDRNVLLLLAMAAAGVMGLGVMLLLDRMDGSFKSVDELRAFTHVPVLGSIPKIVSRRAVVRRVVGMSLVGAGVSVGLWFVSVGIFRFSSQAEALTRALLR